MLLTAKLGWARFVEKYQNNWYTDSMHKAISKGKAKARGLPRLGFGKARAWQGQGFRQIFLVKKTIYYVVVIQKLR